jgi:hypothetical protein
MTLLAERTFLFICSYELNALSPCLLDPFLGAIEIIVLGAYQCGVAWHVWWAAHAFDVAAGFSWVIDRCFYQALGGVDAVFRRGRHAFAYCAYPCGFSVFVGFALSFAGHAV